MTLIAAFRSKDGFALCADSQETIDEYRKSVPKLILKRCGSVDLAIAGSGNNGNLIDAFTQRLHDNISKTEFSSVSEIKSFIERELIDFQNNEASAYSDEEVEMQLIIAVRDRERQINAWKLVATRLIEIKSYDLIGWDEPLYAAVAQRLYRDDLTLEQAELAAMYVLTLAEETSNYVRGPMTVAIVRTSEARLETTDCVRQMGDRLRKFESGINNLFLACAENTPAPIFKKKLHEFTQSAMELHEFRGIMVSKVCVYAVLGPPKEIEDRDHDS